MLAQSLDELAKPAAPVKAAEAPAPAVIEIAPAKGEDAKLPKTGPAPELEAWFEQFQKKVQSEPAVPLPKAEPVKEDPAKAESPAEPSEPRLEGRVLNGVPPSPPPPQPDNDDDMLEAPPAVPAAAATVAPAVIPPGTVAPAEAPLDPAAANVVRKVRRLMLVSMLITFIGVGSVFGIIGYRVYKNDGAGGKLFDPKPAAPAVTAAAAPIEKTLKLPPNARILSAAVAENRLVLTLDVGGKIEVRTFDPRTLEPAARLGFSATP